MRDTQINRMTLPNKRDFTGVCAAVQWSMEEVLVGNKEDLLNPKACLRSTFCVCLLF